MAFKASRAIYNARLQVIHKLLILVEDELRDLLNPERQDLKYPGTVTPEAKAMLEQVQAQLLKTSILMYDAEIANPENDK